MSKQPQHQENARPRDESGAVEREERSRHDEGSAWTKTSEDRAQEGVSPDAREQLPVGDSRSDIVSGWDPRAETSLYDAAAYGHAASESSHSAASWEHSHGTTAFAPASSETAATAPWSPVQAGQGYDPWEHVRHDVYGQQTREGYYQYDYHYYDENYLHDEYYYRDEQYPHEYGTWDHVYETPQHTTYPSYGYVPSYLPEYGQIHAFGHDQAHAYAQHDRQNHAQSDPASAFTEPASAFVAAAAAAQVHLQPEENAHTQASAYVATPEPAFSPGVEVHLQPEQNLLPLQSVQATVPAAFQTFGDLPAVVQSVPFVPTDPQAAFPNTSLLQEWHDRNESVLPTAPQDSFIRENANAGGSLLDYSEAYRQSAHSREEGAANLVSDSSAAILLGGTIASTGYSYTHTQADTPIVSNGNAFVTADSSLSSHFEPASSVPAISSYGSAENAMLPANMTVDQFQALHSHLNGGSMPFEGSAGEHHASYPNHQAPYIPFDPENRLTVNQVSAGQFIVDCTVEDPHLGGSHATAQAMLHSGEHRAAATVLPAPSSEMVREASDVAENLPWMEKGPFWAAEAGTTQMLVQDLGPEAADGRFAWTVGSADRESHLKGFSGTLEDAKACAVLQAAVHGYAGEGGLHAMHDAADPSSFRSFHESPATGERSDSLGGLLVDPDEKRGLAEGFLFAPEVKPDGPETTELLASGSTAETLLLESSASAPGSPVTDHADGKSGFNLKKAGVVAGVATLGTLGFAGRAAVGAGKAAFNVADALVDGAMREDDDLRHVADAKDALREASFFAEGHMPAESRESAAIKLLKAETLAEGAISERGAIPAAVKGREKPGPASADEPASRLKVGKDGPAKGESTGRTLSEKAAKRSETEKLLIDDEKDGAAKKEKKPVTQRERDLDKKKAEKLLAKKDGDSPKAMSVVEKGGKLGAKGALLVGGIAVSSAKKVIASKDENLATALTMVDKGKKAVRTAKSVAKLPVRIYHTAKTLVSIAINAVKAAWHGIVALATGGSAVWVPVAVFLLLVFAVVVIILGTATIVNDDQEISEITALVAELDEKLTEEINEMGASPVLYADATGTYGMKDDDGKLLTIDADLRDGESDLKEVTAKSVTVQTNAESVAAYIDAKYGGEWQVGAASWKFTVDAFGKSWNIIEWDNMPEWARKALNSTDRLAFGVLLQEALKYYVDDVVGLDDLETSNEIAKEISLEMTRLVYDEQLQGLGEDVIVEVVKKTVKKYRAELDVTDDEARQIYYHMNEIITEAIAEYEPVALVYDEVVELHETLNFWSENYEQFDTGGLGAGGGAGLGGSGASGTMNRYGYPNSRGYDAVELAKWDGYNEVSVYGISEAGTTAVTADGTRITNTWSDTNMAIACEGLQNDLFAYWTAGYKAATGGVGAGPVKITLYNPDTGATVTAEVRDCGGWRGFNPNYAGMNADRQWDVLPAVWKALGGGTTAGTMRVYWKVDPDATVGGGAWVPDPITIEGYAWTDETDKGDDEIEITRPTYIAHGIHDLLNNDPLLDETMHKESYPSKAVYRSVKSFVIGKVQGVMQELLAMENSEGDAYIDYLYLRRNLGDPFGKDKDGDPVQWIVTHRYDPGYEDFEHDDAYVEVKPLTSTKKVYAVHKGTVEEVDDGTVTIRWEVDSATSAEVKYFDLKDVKVDEGDEVKRSTVLGKMDGDSLRIAYYEINDAALQMETEKDWAYNPALFMQGFAGYQKPEEPEEYVGPSASRSLADCESIVDFAYSRLGCPYVWGATGPSTFDCSGLTQWCYARAGIAIPRNSEAQHAAAAAAGNAHPINEAEMQPGDILWKSGHVGIYIGSNQYIHAPQTGDVVKVSTGVSYFTHYLRFTK